MFKYGRNKIRKMIEVDCRDIKPVMRDLLIHVSDQTESIPTLKSHGFALEPLEGEGADIETVVSSVREFLDSVGLGKKYAVTAQNKIVTINSASGKPMADPKKPAPDNGLFTCSHCGYITKYEADLRTHQVIHYL